MDKNMTRIISEEKDGNDNDTPLRRNCNSNGIYEFNLSNDPENDPLNSAESLINQQQSLFDSNDNNTPMGQEVSEDFDAVEYDLTEDSLKEFTMAYTQQDLQIEEDDDADEDEDEEEQWQLQSCYNYYDDANEDTSMTLSQHSVEHVDESEQDTNVNIPLQTNDHDIISKQPRSRALRQVTLTHDGYVKRRKTISSQESAYNFALPPEYKDTEEQVYYHCRRKNRLRIFKRGEAYGLYSERNLPQSQRSVYVIQSFITKRTMRKKAMCKVYRKLHSTFIGNINQEEIFQKYLHEANLHRYDHVEMKDLVETPLRSFDELLTSFVDPTVPSNNNDLRIEYEENKCYGSFGIGGHGFNLTYLLRYQLDVSDDESLVFDDKFFASCDDAIAKRKSMSPCQKKEAAPIPANTNMNSTRTMGSPSASAIPAMNIHSNASNSKEYLLQRKIAELQSIIEEKNDQLFNLGATIKTIEAESENRLLKVEQKAKQGYHNSKSDRSGPKVLDVFAGIGGMSQGFVKAGYHIQWAVDKNSTAAAMYTLNHDRDVKAFDEDVRVWLKKVKCADQKAENEVCGSIRNSNISKGDPYRGIKPDHIHFSPPCQAFSAKNIYGGKNDKQNAALTLFCIDIVRYFKPKSISMENVTGLLGKKSIDYLKVFVAAMLGMDMNVTVQILDARRYGDPQKRLRVFVTATKAEFPLNDFPKETHGDGKEDKDEKGELLPRYLTAFDAISDLSEIEPMEGSGFAVVQKSGGGITQTWNHGKSGTSPNSEMEKLHRGKPAFTLRRKGNILHYDEKIPRTLTVREMARLQSFDDDFRFFGTLTEQINGLGNAVPVRVATAVALAIKKVHS